MGKNPEHHSCMKHLNVKYHWLREQVVEQKIFVLEYVSTQKMAADILTKHLDTRLHENGCKMLRLV